jgi:Transposase DDE domain
VTVVEDREGDIYECFAVKPAGVEKLVRASQDRLLANGSRLFAAADAWPEAGRMTIELPGIPGRKARQAVVALRFGAVVVSRPKNGKGRETLPESLELNLVEAREIDPPEGEAPAHWRLLTTHAVNDAADARRIVGFYRLRWTIEQLFRATKTKGFDIESLRQQEGGPLEKLVAATIVAAVTVMQLAAERDGQLRRPLEPRLRPRRSAGPRTRLLEPRRQDRKAEESPSQRLARLRLLGLRAPRRLDRILRKTGTHRHAPRPHRIPRHQARLAPPKCVNRVGLDPGRR